MRPVAEHPDRAAATETGAAHDLFFHHPAVKMWADGGIALRRLAGPHGHRCGVGVDLSGPGPRSGPGVNLAVRRGDGAEVCFGEVFGEVADV